MRASALLVTPRVRCGHALPLPLLRLASTGEKPKIDTSRYDGHVFGGVDLDGLKHFREVEKKFDDLLSDVPKKHLRDQYQNYWPEFEREVRQSSMNDANHVDPFGQEEKATSPYEAFDLDDPRQFAKALAHTSGDINLKNFGQGNHFVNQDFNIKQILRIGRHTKVTAAGRVFTFSALVLLGTGKSSAGLGYGRGNTVEEAVVLAKRFATRNLMSVQLYRGNSIGSDIKVHYKKSYIWMKQRRVGHGVSASPEMKRFLEAFGITDVTVGKGGSRNKASVYRALFKAIRDYIRTPEQVANVLGRKLFNRNKAYYFKEQ